jgi:hypothetical protein
MRRLSLVGLLALACGRNELPVASEGSPVLPAPVSRIDAAVAAVADAAPDPGPDAGPPDAAAPAAAAPLAGTLVKSDDTAGRGPCQGKRFADVLAEIWAARPELKNQPGAAPQGDGFVQVSGFVDDGGFRIILDRGTGDCLSGCLAHELWYFATDEACVPVEVGHGKDGACFDASRVPAWGVPPSLPPAHVCGADARPQNMNGSYHVRGTGLRGSCPPPSETGVDLALTLVVAQDPGDAGRGTVTINGSGEPMVDGHALPATFVRRRFSALEKFSNLPARCADERSLVVEFDFEGPFVQGPGGLVPGRLTLRWDRTVDCESTPAGAIPLSCSGGLSLVLTPQP